MKKLSKIELEKLEDQVIDKIAEIGLQNGNHLVSKVECRQRIFNKRITDCYVRLINLET